jgi:glycosyltransferase involved in cell wall biosynthesis
MNVCAIIPCWNEKSQTISETIASAWGGGADAVVLVDDGSDLPVESRQGGIPSVSDCKIVTREHRGISAALNAGVDAALAAGHSHLAWLSCGDSWRPGKIAAQRATCAAASFTAHHNPTAWTPAEQDVRMPSDWRARLWRDNQFCGSTTMVTREVLVDVRFDVSLLWGVDWQFALEVELLAGWTYVDEVLADVGPMRYRHTDRGSNNPRRHHDISRVARWALAVQPLADARRMSS